MHLKMKTWASFVVAWGGSIEVVSLWENACQSIKKILILLLIQVTDCVQWILACTDVFCYLSGLKKSNCGVETT